MEEKIDTEKEIREATPESALELFAILSESLRSMVADLTNIVSEIEKVSKVITEKYNIAIKEIKPNE